MTDKAALVWALLLTASLAANGHSCKKLGEAEAREKGKDAVIAELRNEPEWLGKIMAGFEHERTCIEDIRRAARQGVREEMRSNPVFRTWADGLLPSSVGPDGGLLGQTRPGGTTAHAAPITHDGAANAAVDGNNQRGSPGVRAGS